MGELVTSEEVVSVLSLSFCKNFLSQSYFQDLEHCLTEETILFSCGFSYKALCLHRSFLVVGGLHSSEMLLPPLGSGSA